MHMIIKMNESEAEAYRAIKREICFWHCFEDELQERYDALQAKYANSCLLLRLYRHMACRLIAFDIGYCYFARKRLNREKAKLLEQLEGRGA
jgi:hypothetical protein